MGPPPDPEQMASMLENPNFASTLNEALSNPDVIEQMIRSNPMFQGAMGSQARQMLQDPNFRRMMTDPETLRSMNQMRRQMPDMFGGMGGAGDGDQAFPMPGPTDDTAGTTATPQQPDSAPQPPVNPFAMFGQPGTSSGTGGTGNPFAMLFGPGAMANANTTPTGAQGGSQPPAGDAGSPSSQQQPATNPIAQLTQQMMQNPQMMQQMMSSMGAAGSSVPAPTADTNSNNAHGNSPAYNPLAALQAMGMGGGAMGGFGGGSPAPQDDRPPEDRYAEQLGQLNDMGFHEFERNVQALRRSGGSVQGAIESLLSP